MRCLILGGGGFIGSHLSDMLLASNHDVNIFSRPNARYLEHVRRQGANVFIGDYLNPRDVGPALAGCEVLYHLVSATVPQTSNDNPQLDIEANVLGTLHLLDEARKAGVRQVVFASSGGTVYGIPQEIPIKENHPTEPTSSYGICKLAIEKYLHLYWLLHGLDYRILRIANAYGVRQPITATQGVISSFLDKALHGEELIIWGDGTVMRDYVYVTDVAAALVEATVYQGEHRIFNVGAGRGHSLNDIIESIEQVVRRPLQLRYKPARIFDVPVNILDISQAGIHLNWQPTIGLQEGISRTYEWAQRDSGK
jgi:UDP-glucose 4-epimerase